MKQYKKTLVLGALILGTVLLACIERGITGSLSTQQLAKRWSKEEEYVQMACYFTEEAYVIPEQIVSIERSMVTALEEASISDTKENGGRNWIDAYSTQGSLGISSNRGSMQARAFGVESILRDFGSVGRRRSLQEQLSADYSWDLTSGDLVLDLVRQGKKYPVRLNLTGEGDTLTLYSQEAEVIQSALTGKEKTGPAICTLVISPGEPVEPLSGYKNLSDWSAEDLLLLITRLGQLIGIKLG